MYYHLDRRLGRRATPGLALKYQPPPPDPGGSEVPQLSTSGEFCLLADERMAGPIREHLSDSILYSVRVPFSEGHDGYCNHDQW